MRLTVHIGTTKTGSTSIQAFLRANRGALLAQGVCVPESLGQQDHRHAALSCLDFGQSKDLMDRQGLTDAAMLQTYRAETHAAYLAEMETARTQGMREVVITSEHLQSRCSRLGNVERFKTLFTEGFDEIRILAYVRPQLDQTTSLYSTTLRNGFADTIDGHVARHMTPTLQGYYDLAALLARWGAVFTPEALIVRPYKALPPQSQGGAVMDFCTVIGLAGDAAGLARPVETNASINAQGQNLLRLFNQEVAAGRDPADALAAWQKTKGRGPRIPQSLYKALAKDLPIPRRRARLIHWIETHYSGKGAEISLDQARRFQAQFDAGNAQVIARYFPDHPEYLEPRWPKPVPSLWQRTRSRVRHLLRPQETR